MDEVSSSDSFKSANSVFSHTTSDRDAVDSVEDSGTTAPQKTSVPGTWASVSTTNIRSEEPATTNYGLTSANATSLFPSLWKAPLTSTTEIVTGLWQKSSGCQSATPTHQTSRSSRIITSDKTPDSNTRTVTAAPSLWKPAPPPTSCASTGLWQNPFKRRSTPTTNRSSPSAWIFTDNTLPVIDVGADVTQASEHCDSMLPDTRLSAKSGLTGTGKATSTPLGPTSNPESKPTVRGPAPTATVASDTYHIRGEYTSATSSTDPATTQDADWTKRDRYTTLMTQSPETVLELTKDATRNGCGNTNTTFTNVTPSKLSMFTAAYDKGDGAFSDFCSTSGGQEIAQCVSMVLDRQERELKRYRRGR